MFFTFSFDANAQNTGRSYRVSGKIYDANTKESLIAASVLSIDSSSAGTLTDEHGYFSLAVKKQKVSLSFSFIGYQAVKQEFLLNGDTSVVVNLSPSSLLLQEVVIMGGQSQAQRKLGIISVPIAKLYEMPPLLGEADVLKSLQYIPGIIATSEGKSDVSIRGSNSDHNLILIDGMPIYNSNHVFGLLSTINPESVKNVNIYKSNIPARFGGRIASVIDIKTKDGNKGKLSGSLSLGTLSGHGNLEIPVIKSKTSLALSFRRSFLDLLLPALLSGKDDKTNFFFYDGNAKLNHRANNKLILSAQYYRSFDKLKNSTSSNNLVNQHVWQWYNSGLQFGLNYTLSNKHSASLLLSNVKYYKTDTDHKSHKKETNVETLGLSTESSISDYIIQLLFTSRLSNYHTVKYGSEYMLQNLYSNIYGGSKDKMNAYKTIFRSSNWSGFIDDEFRVGDFFTLNAGFRANSYSLKNTHHRSVSPRVSIGVGIPRYNVSLRLDYANTLQYIQQVNNNSVFLQSDIWIMANQLSKPINSHQIGIELIWTPTSQWNISISPYWKIMSNLLAYKDGVSFLKNLDKLNDKLTVGEGRALGVELGANGSMGRVKISSSYTLSKTERKFSEINGGIWFPADIDFRHNLFFNASYTLNKHFQFSGSWTYHTGGLQTIPLEMVKTADFPDLITPLGKDYIQIPHRNNFRLPAYHRLDLSANYSFDVKKWGKGSLSLSIYNVYNRMNVYKVFLEEDETLTGELKQAFKQMTMFPVIPSLNFKLEF